MHDSPEPPPSRLSMSIDTLNRARQVWFLVAGADKADAVARAFGGAGYSDIPATGVHGLEITGWLLDEAAGASLPGSDPDPAGAPAPATDTPGVDLRIAHLLRLGRQLVE